MLAMAILSQPAILEPAPSHARFVSFALHPGADPAAVLRALAAVEHDPKSVIGVGPPLAEGLGRRVAGLRAFPGDVPPFPSTAVQLIGGALASVLLMLFFETPHWQWTPRFAAALAWNTLAMSILGMAIYNVMLDRHGAGRASSGFFVVPGASALMAFVLLNEYLSAMAIAGLAASTVGVVLVWWRPAAR